jgi:hypothetical protein
LSQDGQKTNNAEELFLNLAYNRFYDLFKEVMEDRFWELGAWQRFSIISQGFAVYAEVLNYETMGYVVDAIKAKRPPMEAEIGSNLFKFIRNVLVHFPFFETWEDVWVNKPLVNWNKEDQSIDKFLTKYQGSSVVKYRFWEEDKKQMTYLSISFPKLYSENKIYLKDIISEKEGCKFAFIMMKNILNTQVEEINEKA